MSFWRRPQSHIARRVLFQVHLWTGLATGVYALFIGATGAALVFRPELQRHAYPHLFGTPGDGPLASPETVIATLDRTFAGYRYSGFEYPSERRGTFLAYVARGDQLRTVFLDARSGAFLGELPRDAWIQRLQELHFNFLAGQRGYLFNGVGASCLLIMCFTGVVIWWPGVGRVRHALVVHVRRGWRRVLWELHGAAGIWTFVLLLVWSISGIYFSFPVPFRSALARAVTLSPYVSVESAPPREGDGGDQVPPPGLRELVRRAQIRVPGAQLARFVVPSGERGAYAVVLARMRHGDGDTTDEVTVHFDRYSGAELAVTDQRTRTAGDAFLTWLGRLHVGNFGGWPVKIVWFVAGLAFPLLFATGAVMWWNRTLRRSRVTVSV